MFKSFHALPHIHNHAEFLVQFSLETFGKRFAGLAFAVGMVLDDGFWAGMTLYPETKCTANRAIDILELYGNERIWMNSACDWGISVPLAVPRAAQEMKRRGIDPGQIDKVIYQNPIEFMNQSPRFIAPEGRAEKEQRSKASGWMIAGQK